MSSDEIDAFGSEFCYLYFDDRNPSPVPAINDAVSQARGDIVCILNDGARMLSPGIVKTAEAAFRAFPNAVVTPLSWHLGPDVQMRSIHNGYCQAAEDQLLDATPWRTNGYSLFTISVLAGSSKGGWFRPLAESNCLFMHRETFIELGGLDERFKSPGGGLIALDFFRNTWLLESVKPVIMLGEGTFHQVHGGIATNAPKKQTAQRMQRMHDEYESIRGGRYTAPIREPIYLGKIPKEAQRFLKISVA